MKFPNLFIIGAMKAGTSSLHEYLHQHPDIFMSRFKEPQYFAPHRLRWGQKWGQGNPLPEPGIDWYLHLFEDAGNVKYAGESSVSYTARPWVSGCEQRIYAYNPAARFIYIMRDPIERTVSHYWHLVASGDEDRDMLTAVRRKEAYIARSYYAMQLRPYIETFGRDHVFVLTLEELNARPEEIFQALFTWLGVDPHAPIIPDEKFNVGALRLKQTRRHCLLLHKTLKHWRWKRREWMLPQGIRQGLERLAYRSVHRHTIDPRPTVDYLRPLFQQYTAELTELLGRDFYVWSTLYA
ncbi:MAG: sulfotransferase [Candidatus Tectimicrobiota bacterium]